MTLCSDSMTFLKYRRAGIERGRYNVGSALNRRWVEN